MDDLIISFLKQSAFLLESTDSRLVIDPGDRSMRDMNVDYVYATHRHTDHIAAIPQILKNNPDTRLVCNEQTAKVFAKKKEFKDQVQVIRVGESTSLGPWGFMFLEGRHGLFRWEQNTMVVIKSPTGVSFGHAGDSTTIMPFKDLRLTYLAVPIGGLVTASSKSIVQQLSLFQEPYPIIVPMHWLWRSPEKFCQSVETRIPGMRGLNPKNNPLITQST